VQNASLSLDGGGTLRLRHDTDNTTFTSKGVIVNAVNSTRGSTIDVDRRTSGTGLRLILSGPITVSGQDTKVKTLSIIGANGYSLELTGCYTNTFAAQPSRIDAVSANVTLSGPTHDLGGGLILGGAMASGINTFAGTIHGTAGITKTDDATWALSGANAYTGTTSVDGGKLLINGGSIGTTAASGDAVSVSAGGTLGGAGGAVFADVTVAASGALSPGSVNAAGSLTGELTVGDAAQSAAVGFADASVFAVDVDGASADFLAVKGTVALGSGAGDDVNLVVRDISEPTELEYMILEADGGIVLPGTLTVSGSTTMTRYVRRAGNTQLWLQHQPPPGTIICIK
jgi:autotransporter-associated beta strand protein